MAAQAGDACTRQGGCRLVVYFLVVLRIVEIARFGRMLTMQNVIGGTGALLAEAIWHVALLRAVEGSLLRPTPLGLHDVSEPIELHDRMTIVS